ncbi:SPOR domain-containing protein [Halocynthiibacter sp. C4]|uniref:SPOR domain-containing protein n=1 Tax=Halocynthiibacter sp. C4 TaxID=2992758 RepID=UPI00237C3F49|nr:SPOR domain-containing protein [Halocynthiibacter sp. C4]MDE0589745.1 SPOR domain-containing protein [Halocynthiibacter sp. C4]
MSGFDRDQGRTQDSIQRHDGHPTSEQGHFQPRADAPPAGYPHLGAAPTEPPLHAPHSQTHAPQATEPHALQHAAHSQPTRVDRPQTEAYYQPEPDYTQPNTGQHGGSVPPSDGQGSEEGATFMHVLGAVTSLALVVGLGVWGYQLAVRDVSGLPIVRALEGPSRVQPDDPGGQLASNQGLSVNAVQAEGEAEPAAERLQLAPKTVDVLPSDPVVATAPAIVPVPKPSPLKQDPATLAAPAPELAAPKPIAVAAAPDDLPIVGEAIAEEAVPEADDVHEDRLPASVPGLAKSARPAVRPANFASVVSAQKDQASAVEAALAEAVNAPEGVVVPQAGDLVRDIEPDKIPVGTNLVQLGAFASIDIARAEWARLSLKHEGFMAGKDRVIQSASSGGRTFYRLRAHGFADISDARRFCVALKAENSECVPLVTR